MMLHHYLAATARTDEREVRRAMAVALALEIPHDSIGYERFYGRVLDELETTGQPNGSRSDPARRYTARPETATEWQPPASNTLRLRRRSLITRDRLGHHDRHVHPDRQTVDA